MMIDETTGLPEAPKGYYWEVKQVNRPLKATLRVELRVEKEITKTKKVLDELPRRWYQLRPDIMERSVDYTEAGSECVDWEALLDSHTHYFGEGGTEPVGPGWEPELSLVATYSRDGDVTAIDGGPVLFTYTKNDVKATAIKYYRRHPNTAESVQAAAEKIHTRLENEMNRAEAMLRGAEDRAKLIGKYPPKTLKG